MRLKGFILSAGLGTRLKPITNTIPKALVKLGNKYLIEYGLHFLQRKGIKEIGINIHYKKSLLEKFAVENNLVPFFEEEILGTGGYLKNLDGFFDRDLVAINCDTLFFGDEGILERLFKTHFDNKNLITLVLKRITNERVTPFKVEGDYVVSLGKEGDYFFTGLQVLSPSILPLTEYSIVDVYKKIIQERKLGFVEFKGDWFDCGTLNGLINANKFLFKAKDFVVYEKAFVSDGVTLVNSVVYNSKVLGKGKIVNSVVYENAILSLKDEEIKNKIIV